ncbi:MAG: hypothetical protein LBC40_06830 [Dysgonamonadaceae bacterium]|jgi:hypothetical protein|nr:hypothetical protein [Dysgonamonadaceae bacterium]
MKVSEKFRLLTLVAVSGISAGMQAQVTIGSSEQPAKGALLDIKEQAAGAGNVTATTGGVVLPRVKLKSLTTMEPFIPANDPDWTNNAQTRIKERHAGLMVYNLTTDANFKPGVYTWDGTRWQSSELSSPPKAYNGLSIDKDTLQLGGTLMKPITVDLASNTLSLTGGDTLHIATPVNLSSLLSYLAGGSAPGDEMLLISDADGNASWAPRYSLPSTPLAVFDPNGITFNMKDALVQQSMINTGTYIEIPPGRWLLVVTMHVNISGSNIGANDWFWVRSSFVKEGETAPNTAYFEGSNYLISGRTYRDDTTINGYVIMKNSGQEKLKFFYYVGRVELSPGSSAAISMNNFGSSYWKENSIVAFALAE